MNSPDFKYIYCLNPKCSYPQNLPHLLKCNACQFPLIYEGKSSKYRAIKSLDKRREGRVREVYDTFSYEGIDQQGHQYILKVFNSRVSRISQLFNKEKEILSILNHPRIPKLIEDFAVKRDDELFQVLVTQKIESENLEYWLKHNQKISQKQGIEWMKQLVEILAYVHRNGFLHQDIKLSNILVNQQENKLYLIDFSNIPDVISPGYTAPEQADGNAVPASDFFALGKTFIHLLTGKHPLDLRCPQTRKFKWRTSASNLSEEFADLIDELIETVPEKRLSDSSTIYQKLKKIEQSDEDIISPKVLGVVSVLGLILMTFFFGFYLGNNYQKKQNTSSFKTLENCLNFNLSERLNNSRYERRSLGEKRLIDRGESAAEREIFEQVTESIKSCDLDHAITKVQALQDNDSPDPEIQIYLNNLKALKTQKQLIQIVVSLPFDRSPSDLAVLQGVAMAQSFNNNNQDNNLLLIEIAKDDRDDKNIVKLLAQQFVDDPNIKAVIGHRSSNASLWAAPIYQSQKLVMISPTSTSPRIAEIGDYIFQAVFNNDIRASHLVNYINRNTSIQNIMICHTKYSNYSVSLAESIIKKFKDLKKEIKIINQPCFKDSIDYTYERQLNSILSTIQEQKIEGLILIPSADPARLKQAHELVNSIELRDLSISIFGSDTLYSVETFETFKTSGKFPNMILTVPSHPDINPDWNQQAKKMCKTSVTWRTMTAFDATQAVIKGFENSPSLSRQDLQKNLSNPDFKFKGATGNFTFSDTGARQGYGCIVKLSDSIGKNPGTPFQLIQCDDSPSEPN
ncbi:bifunctional serine/threonine-protein kinase/ABC transporter substrate-binding protein [Crocosphaera sp.]|uniref:bifunctional serine/threonine-protein kinase/ABC transporter substrate-binding protein n=1 Tax=Crocosphaera sp. TaxID=2729996 RepID=UPI003F215905|nr:protein kinase [Crocosphaera sp.]